MRELSDQKILYEKELVMFFRDFKIVPVFLKVEGIGKEVQRLKVKRHDREEQRDPGHDADRQQDVRHFGGGPG